MAVMAYRLKLKEDIQSGLRRILVEQCEQAERQLAAAADPATAVHEARKCLKRMRAALRLVRDGLGENVWQRENACIRDVARSLSPLRDRDATGQTLKMLAIDAPRPLAKALAALESHFDTTEAGTANPGQSRQTVMATACTDLAAFRGRCQDLRLTGTTTEIIEQGLKRNHARGRAMLAALGEAPEQEALHNLRKAVQVHWRHMTLLSAAWPEVLKARAEEARAVSMLLGEDQDLAMIERGVLDGAPHGLTRAAIGHIVRACQHRRRATQIEAIARANRLFLGKPRHFALRLRQAWTISATLKGDTEQDARQARKQI
ncbi:MAG: CHAD domain-containing protein [Hyphomicrobiaceae bacterium]